MKNTLTKLLIIFIACAGFSIASAGTVDFYAQSHRNISQIVANGQGLLTGCGFYFIGSVDNVDNVSNITSCEPLNGTYRQYPGGATVNGSSFGYFMSPKFSTLPWLPHQLHLTIDPGNSTRMLFGGEVGPSPSNYATVSIPLDGVKSKFSHFRYDGSPLYSYAANPLYAYSVPEGAVSIFNAGLNLSGLNHAWAEMVGIDQTIRFTITGTSPDASTGQRRPLRLYFVSHPVTNNVEYSLDPAIPEDTHLKTGEKVNLTGHIEVFDTDPATFANTAFIFETENSNNHQIGRADGDGWSVNVYQDQPNSFMNYGPYTQTITPESHTAVFRFLVDNVSADNNNILYIDVYDATANTVLASRDIYRGEFSTPNKYQNFTLGFQPSGAYHALEFRTVWRGGSYVKQDKVVIR